MILYPPVKFDENEWFIIITGILMWAIIFMLPKRFSFLTILIIWLFNFFLGQMTDFIIGKPPLSYYYYNDLPEYEYFDLLLYFVSYPSIAYFFVYFYDKLKLKGWWLIGYIFVWALATTGLEWLSVKYFHLYTFTGWHSLYSIFVFILVYVSNLIVFRFVEYYQPRVD